MDRLTDDVFTHIFGLLRTPAAQAACSQTCKNWHRLEREARRTIQLRTCVGILPEQLQESFPGEWTSFALVVDAPMVIEPDYKALTSDSFSHDASPWLHALCSKESLTSLTLENVHVAPVSLADFLAKRGANLRHLSLERVSGVDGRVMELVSEHCPKLETLAVDLQSGSGFSWATSFSQSPRKASLKHLSTPDWNGAPPALVAPLIVQFSNLESVDLGKVEMWFFQKDGRRIFSAVAGLKKVTSLKLPHAISQQDLLLFLPLLPQIQRLELFNEEGFSSVAPSLSSLIELSTFGSLERYRQLALRSKRLQKVSFQSEDGEAFPLEIQGLGNMFRGCKQLQELSLRDLDLGNIHVANEVASMQDELSRLTSFRLSWFWHCKFTALARRNACQILESCSNLTRLELSFGSLSRSQFTIDQELELVSLNCRSLTHFKLERVRASVPGLALIAVNCKGLARLELEQVAAGDVEVAAIAKHCKNLRTLRLVECKLSKFGVSALAAGLPSLVTLCLERAQKPVYHVAGTFRQRQFMHLASLGVKRPFDKVADQFTKARPFWVAESYAGMQTASMVAYPVLMSASAPPWTGRSEAGYGSWLADPKRTTLFGPFDALVTEKSR